MAIGGVSIVAISLAIYILLSTGFAIYQFGSTKAELVARGVGASTAALAAWMVLLINCALPIWALGRIVVGNGKAYDYAAAMVLPLISYGISLIPANFDATSGRVLTWCGPMRPDGTQHCVDRPGVDPLTGRDLLPMDSGKVEDRIRRKNNLVPELLQTPVAQTVFFDRISGEAKVWYSPRSDGCVDLFNNPGHHPQTGSAISGK